jgi:hypothetical protein
MVFYILTPYKIEAHEHQLCDFLADDLLSIIEQADTKIATNLENLCALQKVYPNYNKYEIKVGKI